MNFNISSLEILNPKLKNAKKGKHVDSALYSYYAGFSEEFTTNLLSQLKQNTPLTVFDSWNGSGTTTFSAYKLGFDSIGSDLNPVMLIIAKARLINSLDLSSLDAICQTIFHNTIKQNNNIDLENEPLSTWFTEESSIFLRNFENNVNKNFINFDKYSLLTEDTSINTLSTIGAFVYVILFKTIRCLLNSFIPSNPTWVKKPKSDIEKISIQTDSFRNVFFEILHKTIKSHAFSPFNPVNKKLDLHLDNSTKISLNDNSVDIVLTSPPYCTRIDYAIATSIELSIIRINDIRPLRDNLIGTSTIKKEVISKNPSWGDTCNTFLDEIYNHPSIASSSYYYKNHIQYFDSLYKSIGEITRILKPNSLFIPIVQNSFYKEINNDLSKIMIEMAENHGLKIIREDIFHSKINMSSINSKSNKYINKKQIHESVLFFSN